MNNELITLITAIAAAMSEGKTVNEITLMALVFTQLGDTLSTIAFQKGLCNN